MRKPISLLDNNIIVSPTNMKQLVPVLLNTQPNSFCHCLSQLFYPRNIVSVNAVVSLKVHHWFLFFTWRRYWGLRYTHETTLLGFIKIMLIHFVWLTPDSLSLSCSLDLLLSLSMHVDSTGQRQMSD